MDLFKGNKIGVEAIPFSSAEVPVSRTMVFICEKCGSKLGDEGVSRSAQKALKQKISEHSRKRELRVMLTSCMNIYPENKIAATLVDLKEGKTRIVSFEWKSDVEKLASEIYRQL